MRNAKFFFRTVGSGWVLLAGLAGNAAERSESARDPWAGLTPFPASVEFAATHQIPVRDIEFGGEVAAPRKGDRATLLVALQRDAVVQQWLVSLMADDLTAAEREAKPAPPDTVMFTSTGLELHFANRRTPLIISVAGPFAAPSSAQPAAPAETRARVLVNEGYLTHGLARFVHSAPGIAARMHTAGVGDFVYATQGRPFSDAQLKIGRPWAAKFALTPDEERWENEAYFAMIAFFETARRIGPLDELARQVLVLPSMWSMARHFGVSSWLVFRWPDVEMVDAARAPVAAPVYRFPLKIGFNETLGARAALLVTAPRPPLQVCAGILALSAEHPTDPGRRLSIRLLAASPAPGGH